MKALEFKRQNSSPILEFDETLIDQIMNEQMCNIMEDYPESCFLATPRPTPPHRVLNTDEEYNPFGYDYPDGRVMRAWKFVEANPKILDFYDYDEETDTWRPY